VLAATAGYAAEAIGWVFFFGLTALAAIPGLALLWWLGGRGHFRGAPKPVPAEA